MSGTTWRLKGDNLSTCNCDWGCPCQFNARPTNGNCEALVGLRINEGNYDGLDLSGVTFAAAAKWPGALHEGNGTIQLVIDEKASPEQRAALFALASGKNGGTFFEILAAVCPNVLEPMVTSIDFATDREKRTGSLNIRGFGHSRVEPIRNPVTGEEFRGQIHLPNGFEYKVAEIANAVSISVSAPNILQMEYSNRHAHLSEIDWSN